VTDFLDETRKEIAGRLKELKPLIEEYTRLEAAAAALAGVSHSGSTAGSAAAPRRREPGRPRGSVSRASKAVPAAAVVKAAGKKPGRPPGRKNAGRPASRGARRKGSGTRAAEALAFVQGQPGITIPELAGKMGIKQNYLYRVLPGLEKEKRVEKKGRGWHARGA